MYINVLLVKIGLGRELVNRIYHQLPVVLLGVLQTPLLINQPMGSFWSRGIWSFPILPSKQTWQWKMDEHNYVMSQNGLSHNMELKTYIITKSTKIAMSLSIAFWDKSSYPHFFGWSNPNVSWEKKHSGQNQSKLTKHWNTKRVWSLLHASPVMAGAPPWGRWDPKR